MNNNISELVVRAERVSTDSDVDEDGSLTVKLREVSGIDDAPKLVEHLVKNLDTEDAEDFYTQEFVRSCNSNPMLLQRMIVARMANDGTEVPFVGPVRDGEGQISNARIAECCDCHEDEAADRDISGWINTASDLLVTVLDSKGDLVAMVPRKMAASFMDLLNLSVATD